ncbi:hypothetical protein GCM10027073_56600 [Streptomyces chlorus]
MPEFESGELAALGVGGEAGDPHAVRAGDPQLCPGMRTFPVHDKDLQKNNMWMGS